MSRFVLIFVLYIFTIACDSCCPTLLGNIGRTLDCGKEQQRPEEQARGCDLKQAMVKKYKKSKGRIEEEESQDEDGNEG